MLLAAGLYATQDKKTLGIRLQSPTGYTSDAQMYFDQNISPAYKKSEDEQMIFGIQTFLPVLFSLTTDSIPCNINGCGTLAATTIIPLGYHAGTTGTYNLSAMLIDNFDVTSVIQLEDRQLGVMIDLRENFYQVELDSNTYNLNRFYIHVSAPVIFTSKPSGCANTGGQIFVNPDSTINWNACRLVDGNNDTVAKQNNVSGPFSFDSLPAGNYRVIFTYNQYNATRNFELNGIFITVSIEQPSTEIVANESVVFSAITTNATQFAWNFGDGSLVNGVENAPQTYFQPGDYTVKITCANGYGCSASAKLNVMVGLSSGINEVNSRNVNIIAFNNTVQVNMNGTLSGSADVAIYNLLGQPVLTRTMQTQKETFDLSSQSGGYYFVTVKNDGKTTSKRVYAGQ